MKDPDEGLTVEGMIKTGVSRDRIPLAFVPAIEQVIEEVKALQDRMSIASVALYVYGSVATGRATSPSSDLDLLTVGVPEDLTKEISSRLSSQFSSVCRGVEIAPANQEDFQADSDESYGGRVFLRHYCLHLYGNDLVDYSQQFPGDTRAARGFNGDIGIHYNRWCSQSSLTDCGDLGRRIARKTLLAVAGLVSVRDHIWTTDRLSSAARGGELNPQWRPALDKLAAWSENKDTATKPEIADILAPSGIVSSVVEAFKERIGLYGC